MILIGSRALALRAPWLLKRQPKDFDFVTTRQECAEWLAANGSRMGLRRAYPEGSKVIAEGAVNVEFEVSESGAALAELVAADPDTRPSPFGLVPSLDMLFTIKSSHKHLRNSPHFWKTLEDYHRMKRAGAKVRPEWAAWLRERERETYNYAHPKLSVNKSAFFDETVPYVYDHDSIHEAVSAPRQPAYRAFAKAGEEVLSSRQMFEACPREVQLLSVVEESAVLAIERSLVPYPGAKTPEQAWRYALSKVCTSIASGWWRDFAYENALEVLRMYPAGYETKFEAGLKSGVVRPHRRAA